MYIKNKCEKVSKTAKKFHTLTFFLYKETPAKTKKQKSTEMKIVHTLDTLMPQI